MRSKSSSSSCRGKDYQNPTRRNGERKPAYVVLLDVTLELRCIDPGHKVLHIPRHEERWIRNGVGSNANMPLLDVRYRLQSHISSLSLFADPVNHDPPS
jgi:hypothetical protein